MRIPKHASKMFCGTILVGSLAFTSCENQTFNTEINLIPEPSEMSISSGIFKIDSAGLLGSTPSKQVRFQIDPNLSEISVEGYTLKVDREGVELTARTEAGLFYGKQTLLQLLTPDGLPFVQITDSPRFAYRGLHLDVSRHFFPKEEVMKILNAMAYYKLNTLHLHGYYTKDDIRDILAYAKEKHVNVIPEIEFPGHSEEVFVAYPELCCAGKPYTSSDFCIGNPKSFQFMEDVLTEVMELFPSVYIHVGGDEASKAAWKKCPKCQALMKKEGLKDVNELQSYMIHHADEFLTSKGRKMIGWDEIMEGGLSPQATVMSWRGESAGFRTARMGQDVVMTPGNYMYLDFYQADPRKQPFAIGGYTPIRKVYSYNPLPKDSLSAEEAKHILGVQANTWTEYITTPEHLEYMMFPRALAVAEIGWTPQEKRDWQDFKPRVNAQIPVLRKMGLNPYPLSYELDFSMDVDTLDKKITVYLDAEKYPAEIHYTTDGSIPTQASPVYKDGILVKDSADIRAAIFEQGQMMGEPSEKRIDYHRGIGKSIHFNNRLYPGYMAGGEQALLDGYRGGLTYLDGRWQGYTDNLDCVIDMGMPTPIHSVSIRCMQLTGPWVYQPLEVELLTSEDGKEYVSQGVIPTTISPDDAMLNFQTYAFTGNWQARYIQLKAKNQKGFIFTDEIVIW